jgi:hypothetical protein
MPKINYSFGSGFGFTSFTRSNAKQGVQRVLLIFSCRQIFRTSKSNSNLRFNYQGATKQPTIDQLQPLRNNQDFFNQVVGNPDLKQSLQIVLISQTIVIVF